MKNNIITINSSQRDDYENIDMKNSKAILKRYINLLKLDKSKQQLTILDVGGAAVISQRLCMMN